MYWMWSVGPLRGGEDTGGGKDVSSGEWCRENQACMIWNEWSVYYRYVQPVQIILFD